MGNPRMRAGLGDGYTEALRAAYPDVPDKSDFVMYWWWRAALEVSRRRTLRAGLITTNSITQASHRPILEDAERAGARIIWAAPDHPWSESANDASVRVAMTVLAAETRTPVRLFTVDDRGNQGRESLVARLTSALADGPDVAAASMNDLSANRGLASTGFKLHGAGFILTRAEAERLLAERSEYRDVVRPYRHGRDLTQRPRDLFVIDFAGRTQRRSQPVPTRI